MDPCSGILLLGSSIVYQTLNKTRSKHMESLCIYNYYEKDESYKSNCQFFLSKGINDKSDFIFVINGESTVEFPLRDNVTVMFRENKGFDFMAYSYVLNKMDISKYKYFIFINTSVRGPYENDVSNWQSQFTSMITNDVKLVGTTINIWLGTKLIPYLIGDENKFNAMGFHRPFTHVQSMMFAMDRECLMYLKDIIFKEVESSFKDTVLFREVYMSQLVLKNNWNINCIASLYHNIDYRTLKHDINYSSIAGDPCYPRAYFGKTITPDDVIFIKTNRGLIKGEVESTEHVHMKYYMIVLCLIIMTLVFVILRIH
jgi:hypothetical protein